MQQPKKQVRARDVSWGLQSALAPQPLPEPEPEPKVTFALDSELESELEYAAGEEAVVAKPNRERFTTVAVPALGNGVGERRPTAYTLSPHIQPPH